MDEIDKSKIITFYKPLKPGEPDPFDKIETTAVLRSYRPSCCRSTRRSPPREWLYDRHYIRGYIGATVAPGGAGKSSLVIVEALAMATGRDLLGVKPRKRLKVWLWNGEDPLDELQRRIAAACLYYGVGQADIDGFLFVASGRDSPWSMASQSRDGVMLNENLADDMVKN